ncbi:MAG TPA: hypothetical protein VHN98_04615 [Acidimicrobiales bacterium]|nr:hypothetical protein [Acidimicrobiales bacterium]
MALSACGGGGDTKGSDRPAAAAATVAPAKAALAISADMVAGTKNMADADKATRSCVLQSRFPRNSQIVWRARVTDAATNTQMDDKALGSLVVKLADGQTFPMKFAQHPKTNPTDAFWATSWTVPADYPSGSVNYTITATGKDGATATFEQFKVSSSLLTITDEVIPTIGA